MQLYFFEDLSGHLFLPLQFCVMKTASWEAANLAYHRVAPTAIQLPAGFPSYNQAWPDHLLSQVLAKTLMRNQA